MDTTIYDVAREAGVSIATVSKALNGTGRISAQTRTRVASVAAELGFVPTRRRKTPERDFRIGILTSDGYGRFTLPIVLGAEDAFEPGRASVIMCDSRDDPIREEFYLESLLQRGVDGIIVTGKSMDPRPSVSDVVPIPVVYAFQPSEDPTDCSLLPDDRHAAGLAVGHLLAIGRKRIVHVTGPAGQEAVIRRRAGLLAALEDAGLELAHVPLSGDWSERAGREAAAQLLNSGASFDAVFCGSDQLARGVVTGLREAGRRVPEEIAVVGVDNWSPIAEAARPPLTTIDLELGELGRSAARLLEQTARGEQLPAGWHEMPCRLVRRGSTDVGITVDART